MCYVRYWCVIAMLSLPKGIQGPNMDSEKLARVLCFYSATLPARLLRTRAAISAACPAHSLQGGYICSLPGSFEPGRLYLQPARLSRARAVKSLACPALPSQGGYISSLPGSRARGRLYLQPARLFRARAAKSPACPALSRFDFQNIP